MSQHIRSPLGTYRQSELTDAAFQKIARHAHAVAGIELTTAKRSMVKSRLSRRLRRLKLASFDNYIDLLVKDPQHEEQIEFISALTTNVSSFFRERHHFKYLTETVLPEILDTTPNSQPLRIWSAGCSNGQEPYSLAMAVREALGPSHPKQISIFASDIDPRVLAFAKAGVYPGDQALELENSAFAQHDQSERVYRITDAIKQLVTFDTVNLHNTWSHRTKFDIIFCRNVMIYFAQPEQESLINRFHDALTPKGWMFIGHSERLSGSTIPKFESIGITAFQKV